MTSPTDELFDRLAERGPARLPRRLDWTVRFELERPDGGMDYWFVRFQDGTPHVSRERRDADCVLHCTREVFDRIVEGKVQLVSAMLRNEVSIEGYLLLLLIFRRMFEPPAGAHDPRDLTRRRRAAASATAAESAGASTLPS
ncbi:SCP2 sterol-binding domain-containing protein [Micromonospora zamorensis]|uniref:SCP2 sterol-binding domain-containing protein n=1 Tax=Micromonospora zamorensis TaxID=709883 RepID=UPI003CEBC106